MRQSGFSLLELLVAFAIMAMSIGLLYRMAGSSARNVADIVQQQHALWLAESLLSSRSNLLPDGWNEEGVYGVYKWRIQSQRYGAGLDLPNSVPLHQVQLNIDWQAGVRAEKLELVTLLPERKTPLITASR